MRIALYLKILLLIAMLSAVGLGQKTAEEYYELGASQREKEQYDAAIVSFTACIRLEPDWGCFSARADCYKKKENYLLAIADLTSALKFAPDDADTFRERAQLYLKTEKYDLAVSDYSEVFSFGSSSFQTIDDYLDRAEAYVKLHKYGLAVADLTKFISASQSEANSSFQAMAKAYRLRGAANLGLYEYDQSVADFSKSIEIAAYKNGASFTGRAMAYCSMGDVGRALIDEKKAKDLGEAVMFPCKSETAAVTTATPSTTPQPSLPSLSAAKAALKPLPATTPSPSTATVPVKTAAEIEREANQARAWAAITSRDVTDEQLADIKKRVKENFSAGRHQLVIDIINQNPPLRVSGDIELLPMIASSYVALKNSIKADQTYRQEFWVLRWYAYQNRTEGRALIKDKAAGNAETIARYLANSLRVITRIEGINGSRADAYTLAKLTKNPVDIVSPAELSEIKTLETEVFALMKQL